jgi:hypothetical protein
MNMPVKYELIINNACLGRLLLTISDIVRILAASGVREMCLNYCLSR